MLLEGLSILRIDTWNWLFMGKGFILYKLSMKESVNLLHLCSNEAYIVKDEVFLLYSLYFLQNHNKVQLV